MAPKQEVFKKNDCTIEEVEREKKLKENAGFTCEIKDDGDKWILECEL